MGITLKFCGAARTVTESCFLMRTERCNFLVDCGLFQGTKTVKQLNYEPFPFDPHDIDFVILTHAHIDHSGLLPKLYKNGFSGWVYMTPATVDLLSFMLPDSGYIQEMEVKQLNKRNAQRGKPQVNPIYSTDDAEKCQENFQPVEYETWLDVNEDVRFRFWNAGHILGSTSIELEITGSGHDQRLIRVLFSGDIGPDHKLFHPDPEASSDFDYVICESTYGGRNRIHASGTERRAMLAREVNAALENDGVLLVPSFAVERTQELLVDLTLLQYSEAIPQVPIFVDSPMAIRATQVFQDHAENLEELVEDPRLLENPNFHFTKTVEESKAINKIRSGAIIMAASGMCEAGRIRHHLKQRLWDSRTTVLVVGFQVEGTLGRFLIEGKKVVRIQGETIQVRANVKQLDAYSGHADRVEIKDWLIDRRPIVKGLFLVHGEECEASAMRELLVSNLFEPGAIFIPTLDDEVELTITKKKTTLNAKHPRIEPQDIAGLDWHNDLAQFQIDVRGAFEKTAGKKARNSLLRRLRRALENE